MRSDNSQLDNIIDRIKGIITITRIMKEYGVKVDGSCPFHVHSPGSSRNSFSVSREDTLYHCFASTGSDIGCPAKGGDIFNLVMLFEKCTFIESVKKCASMAGIEKDFLMIDTSDIESLGEERKIREMRIDILTKATEIFHLNLMPDVRDMIKAQRGWDDETIDKFKIGYSRPDIKKLLIDEGFEESGIVGGLAYDNKAFFESRITYPYLHNNRAYYMIGGRTESTPVKITAQGIIQESKYKKMSTNYLQNIIFNLDSLKNSNELIIGEGVADAISLDMSGYSVISPVTVNFSERDLTPLVQICKKKSIVYICFDNESNKSGESGALKVAEYLFKNGIININIITIPFNEDDAKKKNVKIDACDYLKDKENKKEAVEILMKKHSKQIIDYYIDKLAENDFNMTTKIVGLLSYCDDLFIKTFTERLCKKISVDYITIKNKIKNIRIGRIKDKSEQIETQSKEINERTNKNDITFIKKEVQTLLARKEEEKATDIVAKYIKDNFHVVSLKQDKNSELWFYDEGIRKPNGESHVKEVCRLIYGDEFTPVRISKILLKVEADNYVDADTFFRRESNNTEEFACLNGIYNWKDNELLPFTPDKYFFSKVNAEFNPEADCPEIKKFLRGTLMTEEDVNLMFEIIGFTLLRYYRPQQAIMLIGDGENGKGICLSLIRTLLGMESCSSIPLNQLTSDNFSCSELFGRLANIAGDISNTDLKETGRFKELCSGTDLITAKRKFKQDLFFVNYAKLIFSCNELPRVYDFTRGFWRRWLILEFPFMFMKHVEYEKEKHNPYVKLADPDLINKITTSYELSGLLNEALKGLNRLISNRYQFSKSKSTSDIKDFWIRHSDSFRAFCLDMIIEDENGSITKKDLRKQFSRYCKKYHLRSVSDKNIKFVLEEYFGVIENRIFKENYITEHVWEGIRFKEESGIENEIIKPVQEQVFPDIDMVIDDDEAWNPIPQIVQQPVQPVQAQVKEPVQAQVKEPVQVQVQEPVQPVQAQVKEPVQAQVQDKFDDSLRYYPPGIDKVYKHFGVTAKEIEANSFITLNGVTLTRPPTTGADREVQVYDPKCWKVRYLYPKCTRIDVFNYIKNNNGCKIEKIIEEFNGGLKHVHQMVEEGRFKIEGDEIKCL